MTAQLREGLATNPTSPTGADFCDFQLGYGA
jgi:hypothetical protein